ncbi:hypothetical protein SAMN05445060_2783 [Williamsia sterculiae]|uniref:Uncharacterized protein n=2 Tax=Williamsia sterculiae TaxID=1344003 RepID=A0A1N7GH57_9NOCA|nr:hypothetical protein SAMN05445060_2783 [Williamsia sterculiae]
MRLNRLLLAAAGLLIVLGLALCLLAESLTHGWGASVWGPIGGWVASALTLVAVVVALWQANLARKIATVNQEELLRAQMEEIRKIQLRAVSELSNAVATMYGAFASQVDLEEGHQEIVDIDESHQISTQYILERRHQFVVTVNTATVTARLALVGIVTKELKDPARSLLTGVQQATGFANGAVSKEVNWKVAMQSLQAAVRDAKSLQRAADTILSPKMTYDKHSYKP